MSEELFRNDHFVVTRLDPAVVRIERTAGPFESIEQLETSMRALNAALADLGGSGKGLLVDTRAAPPRNDPEFEQAFEPHRKRMHGHFERQAVLVRTEAGRMQVSRHAEQDGTSTRAFREEAAALEWLRE